MPESILFSFFSCGPDSLSNFILSERLNLPLLTLNMDEHTEKNGLITRLEAFLDILEGRTADEKNYLSPSGAS